MIKRFFNFTEIKTKITSLFAFLMTIAYLFYLQRPVHWYPTAVFFASMFIFDLTTTAINNYIDTKTNHQTLAFDRKVALAIILAMLGISTALGLYLAWLTDVVILLAGGVCFICGILYTYGPVPISRQPLGEVLSGVFYGFFIPFILLYINLPKGAILDLAWTMDTIKIEMNVIWMRNVILLSIVPICVTANIMLANNICDVERDITQKRFTLPYYLGKKALYLFAAAYYMVYIDVMVMVALGILPPVCLVSLFGIFIVWKNIANFFKVQDKETTFNNSIKNYMIIMASVTLTIFLGGLLNG